MAIRKAHSRAAATGPGAVPLQPGQEGTQQWQQNHVSASCHLCRRHVRVHDFADLGGGLSFGACETASCPYLMQELGITHVVQVMRNTRARPSRFLAYTYMSIDIADEEKEAEKLGAAWGAALAFISRAVAGKGRVYVHCVAGISRSPAVCVAFLMKERGFSLKDARAVVTEVRPQACPNAGFEEQLRKLDEELQGSSHGLQRKRTGWFGACYQGF